MGMNFSVCLLYIITYDINTVWGMIYGMAFIILRLNQ